MGVVVMMDTSSEDDDEEEVEMVMEVVVMNTSSSEDDDDDSSTSSDSSSSDEVFIILLTDTPCHYVSHHSLMDWSGGAGVGDASACRAGGHPSPNGLPPRNFFVKVILAMFRRPSRRSLW